MEDLLRKMSELKISIMEKDGQLDIYDQNGSLTEDLLIQLKANKSSLLELLKGASNIEAYREIEKAPKSDFYPLSSAQKRLYFLFDLDKKSIAYNMPQVYTIKGKLEITKLNHAFSKLVERHESLRTIFIVNNEKPFQKVQSDAHFELEHYEKTSTAPSEIIRNFIRPFDLNNEISFRVGLIEVGDEEHILMIDMHHINNDGFSQGILIKEFTKLYKEQQVPELRLQYRDYAVWQQSDEYKLLKAEKKDFWMNQFVSSPEILELPTDFSRPLVKTSDGDKLKFNLSQVETDGLKVLADKSGTTMFMVFLSIYNILLSKLCNQEDITVGTPSAGRQHSDLEHIVGMFVNTLPLRNYPRGEMSFDDFLSEITAHSLSCFENESYQYEELVEGLKLDRNVGRNPLFEVMFSYENFDESEVVIPGISLLPYNSDESNISKFDLTLSAKEYRSTLHLNFGYSTDLFRRETIQGFIEYFKRIVKEILKNPSVKLSKIDILSQKQQIQLLNDFNNSEALYPEDESIVSLFEAQVERSPKKNAIVFDEESITYEDLNSRANQLAHHLKSKGVEKGMVVGVLLNRSIDYVISVLAILKNSGIYLPLDLNYPDERVYHMLSDSGARYLISKEESLQHYTFNKIDTVSLDDDLNDIGSDLSTNMDKSNMETDMIYAIYTSGSTGKPKGVFSSQKGLLNRLYWGWQHYRFGKDEVCCQKTSFGFGDHAAELFSPLLKGVPLVIIDDFDLVSTDKLVNSIQEHGISRITLVPSLLKVLLKEKRNGEFKLEKLKYVFSSGEALTVQLSDDFHKEFESARLINVYGSSEVSADATYYEVPRNSAKHLLFDRINEDHETFELEMNNDNDDEGLKVATVPIGKPLDNTRVLILDKFGNLQPTGVVGEIYVLGHGVAAAYINNEGLSAKSFVPSPYFENQYMYRTGDLGKWNSEGDITYLGRKDNQVKIRGYRIELGEIGHHIREHEAVNDVVVDVKNKYLVAYIVSDIQVEPSSMMNYLSDKIPDYMIPTFYVQLKCIPLNANGKIDKKKLPDPEIKAGKNYEPPSNEIEENLVGIWAELLNLDKEVIGVSDNFFELGGHSLLIMELGNKINKTFNLELPSKEVFMKPTIKQQATFINLSSWVSNKNSLENRETNEVII